jgi:hypothetical protein
MRGRLGAMRGTECVVDVHVAELRHPPRERFVVLLLAGIEAAVLEKHDVAGLERRVPRTPVDPVSDERNGTAQELGQPLRNR